MEESTNIQLKFERNGKEVFVILPVGLQIGSAYDALVEAASYLMTKMKDSLPPSGTSQEEDSEISAQEENAEKEFYPEN